MSRVGADNWRVRYFGPWTWRARGVHGWTFPRRRWGWRLVVTARGERLDVRGALFDVVEAGLYFPNVRPAGACGRCSPSETGETVDVRTFIESPCQYPFIESPCRHLRSVR